MSTETRAYVGETGTQAFDGFKGRRIDQRYTGVCWCRLWARQWARVWW